MGSIGIAHGDAKGRGKDTIMAERLALAVIPGVGWSAAEIQTIAQETEAAGFDAIFAAEVNNDVMATAQLMGAATSRIQVGTWIANVYLRHSYTCAQGAAIIADATGAGQRDQPKIILLHQIADRRHLPLTSDESREGDRQCADRVPGLIDSHDAHAQASALNLVSIRELYPGLDRRTSGAGNHDGLLRSTRGNQRTALELGGG
jgi:hypothetical protein